MSNNLLTTQLAELKVQLRTDSIPLDNRLLCFVTQFSTFSYKLVLQLAQTNVQKVSTALTNFYIKFNVLKINTTLH